MDIKSISYLIYNSSILQRLFKYIILFILVNLMKLSTKVLLISILVSSTFSISKSSENLRSFRSDNTAKKDENHSKDEKPLDYTTMNWDKYSDGKQQSPINIDTNSVIKLRIKSLSYSPTDFKLTVDSHGLVQHPPAESNNYIILNDGEKDLKYYLLQYHVHHKSEHTLDNKHSEIEVHFVHQVEAKYKGKVKRDLAVVGLFFDPADAESKVPPAPMRLFNKDLKADVGILINNQRAFYHYDGGLTTPPCTENVHWFVGTKVIKAKKEELDAIIKQITNKFHANNDRKLQKLNGRPIEYYLNPSYVKKASDASTDSDTDSSKSKVKRANTAK